MKVLVCGDRHWWDNVFLSNKLKEIKPTFIITGGATGADAQAEHYAIMHKVNHTIIYADWEEYGKKAGPLRNIEMLKLEPELVIGFHDDIAESKGTKHMLEIARKKGIPTVLFSHD